MEIIKADLQQLHLVECIVIQTISKVYPCYYPKGAVDFFLEHHSSERIQNDIQQHRVYLLYDDTVCVGTVTINGNEIGRLFVLPDFQGMGYGKGLLDFAEEIIFEGYNTIVLDSSLPAKQIYLNRGYKIEDSQSILTENGDFLCYDIMKKYAGNEG